jgi:hypothetical protein
MSEFLKGFWYIFRIPILIVAIGIIVGLITNNGLAGFFTMGGLIVALAIYGVIKKLKKG